MAYPNEQCTLFGIAGNGNITCYGTPVGERSRRWIEEAADLVLESHICRGRAGCRRYDSTE